MSFTKSQRNIISCHERYSQLLKYKRGQNAMIWHRHGV